MIRNGNPYVKQTRNMSQEHKLKGKGHINKYLFATSKYNRYKENLMRRKFVCNTITFPLSPVLNLDDLALAQSILDSYEVPRPDVH